MNIHYVRYVELLATLSSALHVGCCFNCASSLQFISSESNCVPYITEWYISRSTASSSRLPVNETS
jgi:hypothetical protein